MELVNVYYVVSSDDNATVKTFEFRFCTPACSSRVSLSASLINRSETGIVFILGWTLMMGEGRGASDGEKAR